MDIYGDRQPDEILQNEPIRPQLDYTKQVFACKIYNSEFYSTLNRDMVKKEIEIHSKLSSEYCIRLYEVFRTENRMYLILEYANCNDL